MPKAVRPNMINLDSTANRAVLVPIADYKVRAEQLGYKVLVAEGSPVVLKIIVSGYVEGILGVACLNVLEKAIDKVLIAGGAVLRGPSTFW